MDIKSIYCMLEKITECAKCELEEKGIENIDTEEFGKVTDMIKDLAEAMYYRSIVVAMDESEYGEEYDWEGRKGYRSQPRDSMGRYRKRRGYEDKMPMYEEDAEWMRDMDKNMGRMYYTESGKNHTSGGMMSSRSQMENGMRDEGKDSREGRSGQSRKNYMEVKDMHKGNTPEDKQTKLRELDKYIAELGSDITDMISDASPEEKNLLKTKLTTLATKIS